MKRIAFKMKLNEGTADEYKRRHAEIWPKLKDVLKSAGISNYSIFIDYETNDLFALMNVEDENKLSELPNHAVMREWWEYMKDLMQTNDDASPATVVLTEIFYLP